MSEKEAAAQTIQAGSYEITYSSEPEVAGLTATLLDTGIDGIVELELVAEMGEAAPPPSVKLEWKHPMVDTHLRWMSRGNGAIPIMPWKSASSVTAKATSQAPIYNLLSIDGTNQLTFAISDATNNSTLRARMSEEEATLFCSAEVPGRVSPSREKHSLRLRIDTRKVSFDEAIVTVRDWWEGIPEYAPMPVPDTARLPMYSTWYSFHLDLTPETVEAQCRMAKELGMEAVIVDDGWQTDVTARGYSYCGDWQPVESKFPDFSAHVKRVQDMGMKYLLWFSVPFVGVNSEAYKKFNDYLLNKGVKEGADTFCLDPRCEPAREYLIQTYEKYVRDYGVDGLKLDFVDAFGEPNEKAEPTKDPADVSVAEAAASLLAEISDRLQAINPDIMLEFRQSYVGPVMRRCGNIFRVGDVPNDFPSNRVHSVDVRLLAGSTAVHSDMVMWHEKDSVESAAMQLVHALFAVPQISVLIDEIPENHRKMISAYLKFWREHRDVILDGSFKPLEPGMMYPQVQVANDSKWLAAVYSTTIVEVPESLPATALLVNGTLGQPVVLSVPDGLSETRTIKVYDCMGQCVREEDVALSPGLMKVEIPAAGTAVLS